ncbi:hypothetical protein CsSME_00004834 [Camellia sinensis var. sinensis]
MVFYLFIWKNSRSNLRLSLSPSVDFDRRLLSCLVFSSLLFYSLLVGPFFRFCSLSLSRVFGFLCRFLKAEETNKPTGS